MTTEELITKAKEFCEGEYTEIKRLYNRKGGRFYHDDSIVDMGIQHCVAVVQFIQSYGKVKYEDISWYNDYRKKFSEIQKNY